MYKKRAKTDVVFYTGEITKAKDMTPKRCFSFRVQRKTIYVTRKLDTIEE
jgi:hypothetical protein